MPRFTLIGFLIVALIAAAVAEESPTDVPDPLGLGERLALIDYLREHKATVPEDASLPQLRALYREKTGQAATLSDGSTDEDRAQALEREAAAKLRRQVIEQYHVEVPADASLKQVQDVRDREASRVAAEIRKQLEQEDEAKTELGEAEAARQQRLRDEAAAATAREAAGRVEATIRSPDDTNGSLRLAKLTFARIPNFNVDVWTKAVEQGLITQATADDMINLDKHDTAENRIVLWAGIIDKKCADIDLQPIISYYAAALQNPPTPEEYNLFLAQPAGQDWVRIMRTVARTLVDGAIKYEVLKPVAAEAEARQRARSHNNHR